MKKQMTMLVMAATISMTVNASIEEVESYLDANNITARYRLQADELKDLSLETVYTHSGIVHIDYDKNILIQTDNVYKLENGSLASLIAPMTKSILDQTEHKIVKKASNEKFVIQVFTDIGCGYCQQMHREIESYTDAGITVEFLLFSRNGMNDQSFLKMSSFESRANPLQALQDAMHGHFTYPAEHPSKQALAHQEAGMLVGVRATPAIYYNGLPLGGYIPAAQLVQALEM
ncbi:thioredoxin fold domain-containing protein [Photobacterium lutimaris]|nr:thioredoxin fold domain-containing protein [Photobacterium lutimaris]